MSVAAVAPRVAEATTGPSVTYVVSQWGAPTQTFVRREATAVAAGGGRVRALSIKPPGRGPSPFPATHLRPAAVIVLAARTLLRHPRPGAGVLATVLRRSSPRTVTAHLVAAAIGLAWVQRPEARADLLHAHFGWVAATAAWASTRITGGRYSVVLHAFELHSRRRLDRFATIPLAAADQVFTISERDRELVERRWGIRAEVLRMGVPESWLDPPAPTAARDPDLVVAVGSLVPKKGHAVLIDAIGRTRSPWRLAIVGEGPERAALERRIAARGLAGRVTLLGACDEAAVRDLLRRASVAALACVVAPDGDRDGIPVALMEAMASGVPVVTTRVGAIPELVDGAGLLVAPGDPGAFAAALDTLADAGRRATLAAGGRRRVEREFRAATGGRRVLALARGDR